MTSGHGALAGRDNSKRRAKEADRERGSEKEKRHLFLAVIEAATIWPTFEIDSIVVDVSVTPGRRGSRRHGSGNEEKRGTETSRRRETKRSSRRKSSTE